MTRCLPTAFPGLVPHLFFEVASILIWYWGNWPSEVKYTGQRHGLLSSGSGQELPFSPWNITLNLWSRICSNDSLASHTKLSSLRMLNKEVGSHLLEWIEIVSDLWKEGIVYKCRLEMLPSLTVFPLLVLMVCMGKWLTQPHSFTSLFLSIGDNLREQKEL